MGKEWLSWGGAGSSKRAALGGGGEAQKETTTASAGCMSSVFHLFQLPSFKLDSFLSQQPTVLKGEEGTRNSLEITEERFIKGAMKEEGEAFSIPMGIQIKTSGRSKAAEAPKARTDESELLSPMARTPNLVARLMGLDLLPDPQTPVQNLKQEFGLRQPPSTGRSRSSRSILLDADIIGSRSLPETPRMSAARRSDVDHRFSLQINKENVGASQELEQISAERMKQVIESRVGRKFGMDLSNNLRNRDQRRDGNLVVSQGKNLLYESFSCSPRLKSKNKVKAETTKPSPLSSIPVDSELQQPRPKKEELQSQQDRKRSASERYGPRLRKLPKTLRNKQEEPFVRSPAGAANKSNLSAGKCRKPTLPSKLPSVTAPSLFAVKREPSSPTTKLPQKQVSGALSRKRRTVQYLSSSLGQTYDQKARHPSTARETRHPGTTVGDDGAELQYIKRILKCTGIINNVNTDDVSFPKFHSPAHPLHPSIFHHLELSSVAKHSHLKHRCNRKLLFQLLDELLAEIMKPSMNAHHGRRLKGSQLIEELSSRIRSFVSEDIDGLIEKDFGRKEGEGWGEFEEEGEAIVAELEGEMVDWLVHETAMEVLWGSVTWRSRDPTLSASAALEPSLPRIRATRLGL
ncbi:uncharacterized protein LOC127813574 isoform X2 [Diospyros lotus]|uniref:uncharacterized protein LOC127813574 isoform X2 n=1 Tax=Diospyros lotus TaxID=55363 RepID=UPI00225B79DE|nr:uncharacterized protein LOC127813574 isoform X2 [Diospyros lotus]